MVRNVFAEFLVQTYDNTAVHPKQARVVVGEQPPPELWSDLELGWKVCKHVKSNAIVIVKDKKAIGIGAGQMSRVDAARLAVERAKFHGHDLQGAVAASDAFLPFPDTLEMLGAAGICALIQPGGSVKDEEVIKAAKAGGMLMVFTGERHFKH